MDAAMQDRLAISEVVQNWALWRDAGDWERFRTVWHEDGWMSATWFQAPANEFIDVSREGFNKGVSILHFLGGCSVDLAGDRAVAQTKMTISQRGMCDGVLVDVVCTGRFFDFFERRAGRWAIVRRQPIYEKDRMDPVGAGREALARRRTAAVVSRRLPPPRVPAVEDRLQDQDGHAAAEGPGGRGALRARPRVARRRGLGIRGRQGAALARPRRLEQRSALPPRPDGPRRIRQTPEAPAGATGRTRRHTQ